MKAPDTLLYTKDHEWVRREGQAVAIGITDFAQSELGEIVYVELPEVGSKLEAGREFGTVESVKAVSEIFAPVSGEVIEVNDRLREAPESVNKDPYGEGWILRVRPASEDALSALMSAAEYERLLQEGAAG